MCQIVWMTKKLFLFTVNGFFELKSFKISNLHYFGVYKPWTLIAQGDNVYMPDYLKDPSFFGTVFAPPESSVKALNLSGTYQEYVLEYHIIPDYVLRSRDLTGYKVLTTLNNEYLTVSYPNVSAYIGQPLLQNLETRTLSGVCL